MARDTTDLTPISSTDDLVDHLRGGEKPADAFRIGTEHEKFPFYRDTLEPVPFQGPRGIEAILRELGARTGWEPILDDNRLIGLSAPAGSVGGAISLEPGGQFELSGAPLETVHDTCRESNRHLADVKAVAEALGVGFLGLGSSPSWRLDETPAMPKSRYAIMRRYMPRVGTRGLDMMFRTSTIQVNLDFSSEADMARKMRIGLCLQPVASALFANSPFTEGAPNGFRSWRSGVWEDVDNARAGLLPFAFEPTFSYRAYVEWALDVPMYFAIRGGRYVDATAVTFRQFLDGAFDRHLENQPPSMGDWTNHLSTLFPDVRLKRFLEMRGADGGPWRALCALPAVWVGRLDAEAALAHAAALPRDWRLAEVAALRAAVPREGFRAPFRNGQVLDVAREAVSIARRGLAARARLNEDGFDETVFLAPLNDRLARGMTAADDLISRFEGPWKGDMGAVFRHLAY